MLLFKRILGIILLEASVAVLYFLFVDSNVIHFLKALTLINLACALIVSAFWLITS